MHEASASGLRRSAAVFAGLLVIAAFLTACISAPVAPMDALSEARATIDSAEQAGARQYAGAELDEARQKLVLAEEAVVAERMVAAERFARQSQVTAELALARTASAKAAEINRQMGRGADALDEEMERMGEQQ